MRRIRRSRDKINTETRRHGEGARSLAGLRPAFRFGWWIAIANGRVIKCRLRLRSITRISRAKRGATWRLLRASPFTPFLRVDLVP